MATEIKQLIMHSFDNMENHNPYTSKVIATFASGDGLTAHGKAAKYIAAMDPVELFLGWDGQVYPKFELITLYAK